MAKKQFKNKKPSKKWEKYTVSGDTLQRKQSCPKCGPSYFFAEHKDRNYCGNCHYVEIKQTQ